MVRTVLSATLLILLSWALADQTGASLAAADPPCFIYASGNEVGAGTANIKCFHFDPATAALTPAVNSVGGANPGYLAWVPGGNYLYAINSSASDVAAGNNAVSAFRIDHESGALTRINGAKSGGTSGIVHLCQHPTGNGSISTSAAVIVSWIFVTHYSALGEVSSLPIYGDGHVGDPISTLNAGQYAHQVVCNAAGTRLYVPCLGANHVRTFAIAADGTLTLKTTTPISNSVPPINRGPRHAAFSADETRLYVINELDNTVTTFAHNSGTDVLSELSNTTTLPSGYTSPSKCAHVLVSPNGLTLYGSNRRKDTTGISDVVAFGIDQHPGPQQGALLLPAVHENAGGQIMHPRDFAIDPSGLALVVASRGDDGTTTSGWLNVFRITPATGALNNHALTTLTNRPDFVRVMTKVRVLASLVVTPASMSLSIPQTQAFTAQAYDQCGDPLNLPAITWTKSGGGSISATGVFTANAVGGPFTITASGGGKSGTASVTVTANTPPTAPTTPIVATPNPVSGMTTSLSITGANDNGGEPALTYAWSTTGTLPAAVSFSGISGTNAAKNTTATFIKAGDYTLRVTITDAGNLSITREVAVTVNATPTSVVVTPASATLATNATQTFVASAKDQFGAALTPQPTFTWTTSGGGSVTNAGEFTAPASAVPCTVTVSDGTRTASAAVTTVVAGVVPPASSGGGGGGGCGLGAGIASLVAGILLMLRLGNGSVLGWRK